MKYKLKVYSIWEYGQRKDAEGNPHQEDSTYPAHDDLKDTDRTFILCDGMGGHDAGEVASATVCRAMGDYILNDGHDADGIFTDEDLKSAIDAAFSALDKMDNGAEKKMGTTMTFLKLHNDGATIAHMGDSRVYHIRPGERGEDTSILFETEDHSLLNDLIKIGELTKEEARTSKQKNIITRAMQPNMDRKPKADIKHITDIKAGDYFYMCSDGMLEQEDMANGESIRNIFSNAIKSVDDKINILTEVTKNNKDNHTALIIHILDVEGGAVEEESRPSVIPSIGEGLVEGEIDDAPVKGNKNCAIPPKYKFRNLVLRTLIAAIIVAVCIISFNYIPSCSKKSNDAKIEFSFDKETQQDGKTRKEKGEGLKVRSKEEPQDDITDDAIPESSQSPEEEAPKQSSESTDNTPPAIQLPSSPEVVRSDQQVIQDKLNK